MRCAVAIGLVLMAFVLGAESEADCYKCWYQSAADKLFGDDDCNTIKGLGKVDIETKCNGKCYAIEYRAPTGLGFWIKRGCEEDVCENGPFDIVDVGTGNRTCCNTDRCNDAIFDVSSATLWKASTLAIFIFSVFITLHISH